MKNIKNVIQVLVNICTFFWWDFYYIYNVKVFILQKNEKKVDKS